MGDALPPDASSEHACNDAATLAVSAPSMPATAPSTVGNAVSRYVVLEEVGRGGMGRVLRAYDPKLQREVALKEVRQRQMDAEARRRLVAEARAMAKLSHPNVVAVFDVDQLPSGGVVLVMEYVAGQTLKGWLKQKRPWRDIVDRFVDAGRGVAAAHEAGLLHRDFKPTNVLVSDHGTVKVTDFGLAKAANGVSSSGSVDADDTGEELTEEGTVMGTPRYMAPEQHRGDPLTPAADQYAFCVALWEALCEEPPFSGKGIAAAKHAGPPTWPGQRSGTGPIVDAVVRGLSPLPENRWPSMEALLEALGWDPSRRRTRWLLGLGGLAVLATGSASYQAWGGARAKRCSGAEVRLASIWDDARRAQLQAAFAAVEKSYADEAWTRTERTLDAYASDWATMHTETCEATTVRGEQSPAMMDLRMGCLDRAAVDLRAAVETLAEADAKVVLRAHKAVGALPQLSRCADADSLTADVKPPSEAEAAAVDTARSKLARARSLQRVGRYDAAQSAIAAARETLAGVEYGPVRTEAALAEGDVLTSLGQYEAAETVLAEALRHGARWRQWRAVRGSAKRLMFVLGQGQRRGEVALRYQPLVEGLSQEDPQAVAEAHNSVAVVMDAQGKFAEAELEFRAALALKMKALGADHPHMATARNNLGSVLYSQGKYGEAESEHRAALALWMTALGPNHPDVAGSRNNLAMTLTEQGKHAEAEAEFRTALAVLDKALRPEHPMIAALRNNLGLGLAARREYARAEEEYRRALAAWETSLGPEHPHVASARSNLATALHGQGKLAEAETEHRAALAVHTKLLDPDHPHIAMARHNLAEVMLDLDRPVEALALAELVWPRRQQDDIPPLERARTAFLLAQLLWSVPPSQRDRPRARTLAEDARASYEQAGQVGADPLVEVQQWIHAHPSGLKTSGGGRR